MQDFHEISRRFDQLESDLESGASFEPLEETLRAIVDSVPDIVYRVDAGGRIVFISDAIRKYGYDPARLIGTSLFDLIHPEDRDRARHRVNDRRTGERSTRSLQLRLISADDTAEVTLELNETDTPGSTLEVDAQGVYDSDVAKADSFLYTQGVARDISERRRVEQALEAAQREVARRMGQHAVQIRAAYDQVQTQIEERHRREAERAALQSVRDEIWRMDAADDLPGVLRAISASLRRLEIDFYGISMNAVIQEGDTQRVLHYAYGGDESGWIISENDQLADCIQELIERGQPMYRPDLHAEDLLGERETVEQGWGPPIRSVVNVPFATGTLAVNSRSPQAFSEQDLRVLYELGSVLEEGFRRVQDLTDLQRHASESETLARQRQTALRRERTLGRIRDRVLSMRSMEDIPDQAYWIGELRDLGVPIDGISMQLPGPTRETFVSYIFQKGYFEPESLDDFPWIREVWEGGEPVLVDRQRLEAQGYGLWAMHCLLEMPMPGGGSLAVNRKGGSFDDEMVSTVVAFSGAVASGLQRLRDFERLADNEHRYRYLVEQLPIGVVHTATSGRILYQNPYVRSMLGYTTEELNSIPVEDLYPHPDDRRQMLRSLKAEGSVTLECPLTRRGGGTVWVRGTARAVTDPDSGRKQYHGYIEDVTEQKMMEDEYSRLEEQLRQSQKMEAVGQLTAGIAHNFNNMLQGISGNLQLALLDADTQIRSMLKDADRVTHRAADMIRQLLLFARQGLPPTIGPMPLAPVINNTIGICRRTFDRKIEIEVQLDSDLTVLGDPGLLQQLFLNLLINARDAIEATSKPRITISAAAALADHPQQPGSDESPRSVTQVRIADNGAGMDEATRRRIYDPFFTTKPVDKGTGLGLATVYGIVTQHEGWIACDSTPGRGTTFSVSLPSAAAPAVAASAPTPAQQAHNGTLLVIDDEEVIRETTCRLLERCGYRVLLASSGREGIGLFREQGESVQLVLLDLSMPEMSGKEVLSELRHLRSDVKVLIFTGYATGEEEVEGADGIVQKPFSVPELTGKIRTLLGQ